MTEVKYQDKMIVNDIGICQRLCMGDNIFSEKIVITKEAFIEAYKRYIKEEEK